MSVALAIPDPFPIIQDINFEVIDEQLPEVAAIDATFNPPSFHKAQLGRFDCKLQVP